MENENPKVKLHGTIVFLKTNEGSKSEVYSPFLYQNKDEPLRKIMLKDDNPFENKGLFSYDGKTVDISGEVALSGTFIADDVVLSSEGQQ